ncbi:MAG TPA: pyridoxamine 5'-phosphate oxidase family protein [Candidatus Alistipes avicola]|uniref:Pyridoxamine 5'-phosphate oxidase family protein n=1 Tax=Candidatus Alistipes avicola TaxID=2838432 RepID=A0A9D2IDN1_9BACT|nr:pyridoxamine 5'-phosphate oxidase family protein [uncultured Alistipes sp.]HJA98177.1 pyridoxamine 5'-phosphate oxidase family protein [Candidatus Alistipes avicola]
MEYRNDQIRRQDRLLDHQEALKLLKESEYGFLSMQLPDGGGYGIPINYAWDGTSSLYIHCAPEGKKLDCIRQHPDVSFCIVGRTEIQPAKFTTAYESVHLCCRAHTDLPDEERHKALELILEKYSPQDKEIGLKYAEKSFHRTAAIRLDILTWSGKCKKKL